MPTNQVCNRSIKYISDTVILNFRRFSHMKNAALVMIALAILFALPAFAQTSDALPEIKAVLYKNFSDNIKSNPAAAYEAGKDYLSKYGAADGDNDKYVAFIKKWSTAYEKSTRRQKLIDQLKNKKVNDAFATAKQVTIDSPDDLQLLYNLASVGYTASASGNETNNADAAAYAKQAIELVAAGKSFDMAKPFTDKQKDEALSNLHYIRGALLAKSSPSEARDSFLNAATIEGPSKTDPSLYINIFQTYQVTDYQPVFKQYKDGCDTPQKEATPACTELAGKLDASVDHIIDALARAISYANSSPNAAKYADLKVSWMAALKPFYQYRHDGSDAGMNDLIANIASKPLPK
jgi:hypothetical protein